MELTEQDREEIQNQIVQYKAQQVVHREPNQKWDPIVPPTTPDGKQSNKAL